MLDLFENINSILDSIKGTIDVIPNLKSIGLGSTTSDDSLKLDNNILEAQNVLSKIQLSYNELIQAKTSLEEELVHQKQWNKEKENYILQNVGSTGFVYTLKPNKEFAIPNHWLCTNCYENGKKSILQISLAGRLAIPNTWKCFSCQLQMQIKTHVSP